MTENEIRNAFHDDSEFNTADNSKDELLRRTTAGFGDDHTIIVSLESGVLKLIACTEDKADADAVLAAPIEKIEFIKKIIDNCYQVWLIGNVVFQLGQYC